MSFEYTPSLKDPRTKKTYYFHITPVRRIMTANVAGIFRLISILNVAGVEHLPANGPVILAANHLSNFDAFPMQFALPRPIFFMGKAELFRNPLLDWFLRHLGGFPVNRGEADEWAFQHARRVLERGQVLGIFPEGKRSKGKGLHRGKTGMARLALAAGCSILPMAVHGPQYMLRRFPRRTPIHIKLGAPVLPLPGESPAALTDRVMYALSALLPPESRGVYRQASFEYKALSEG